LVEIALCADLFGAHVLWRADRDTGDSDLRRLLAGNRARDPEVGKNHRSFGQQNVSRLYVTVDHAAAVRVVERAGDVLNDRDHRAHR
jgi:hypothetical protein